MGMLVPWTATFHNLVDLLQEDPLTPSPRRPLIIHSSSYPSAPRRRLQTHSDLSHVSCGVSAVISPSHAGASLLGKRALLIGCFSACSQTEREITAGTRISEGFNAPHIATRGRHISPRVSSHLLRSFKPQISPRFSSTRMLAAFTLRLPAPPPPVIHRKNSV